MSKILFERHPQNEKYMQDLRCIVGQIVIKRETFTIFGVFFSKSTNALEIH